MKNRPKTRRWRRRRDSNPRYRIYQYDGLANPDLSRAECLNSRTFLHFHAVKPHTEPAASVRDHKPCRHESRHTSQGGKNDIQNLRLRADSAKRAASKSAVTVRPLGGLQPSATVHDIAGQLHYQNTFPGIRGQAWNARESSHEHYIAP